MTTLDYYELINLDINRSDLDEELKDLSTLDTPLDDSANVFIS